MTTGNAPALPSGEQFEISFGDQRAVVVEVGGGLRSYSVSGQEVLDGYRSNEQAQSGRGQLLIPWPNRLRDGSYELDGQRINSLPAGTNAQARVKPIYESFEGWSQSTRGARTWGQLPAQAVKYVRHIEELIECPVTLLSTSPERDDTILVRDPFVD